MEQNKRYSQTTSPDAEETKDPHVKKWTEEFDFKS
jgi:hypothetical protein